MASNACRVPSLYPSPSMSIYNTISSCSTASSFIPPFSTISSSPMTSSYSSSSALLCDSSSLLLNTTFSLHFVPTAYVTTSMMVLRPARSYNLLHAIFA